ncbi:unnamed protein product [Choristocarpus tenellus]
MMDMIPTQTKNGQYLGFLNLGWGMISDVDFESEAYRWMGSLRFTVGAIVRILFMRHYAGRVSFLPVMEKLPRTGHGGSYEGTSAVSVYFSFLDCVVSWKSLLQMMCIQESHWY